MINKVGPYNSFTNKKSEGVMGIGDTIPSLRDSLVPLSTQGALKKFLEREGVNVVEIQV